MKIKHVLTAAAVFCCLTTAAFADESSVDNSAPESAADSNAPSEVESATDGGSQGNSDTTVDTGIGGVAAVIGVITLAGAAVVISRKKS